VRKAGLCERRVYDRLDKSTGGIPGNGIPQPDDEVPGMASRQLSETYSMGQPLRSKGLSAPERMIRPNGIPANPPPGA
jgi:hypothetical protein